MWIPSHVGERGNERADQLAGDAVENDIEWHAPVCPSDFLNLSRVRLLEGWHSSWDGSDMGRYAYSIWPVVSFMPWLRRFVGNRVIISMINRMMANHLCLRSHLVRIGSVCLFTGLWDSEQCIFRMREIWRQKAATLVDLSLTDKEWGIPIRDILGGRDWRSLRGCCSFFRRCNLKIWHHLGESVTQSDPK
jgi:hypothetical protein